MKRFAFVILHYYTIEDTKKCVESILEKCNNVYIVIVDNASPNNTGKELEKLYKTNNKIKVILSKENLGFAKGNNIGFKYAKEKLNADFIIMCNNDTYLLQDDFLNLIEEEYKISKFAVLGPKILLPNNKINTVQINMQSLKSLKKQQLNTRINYITNYLYINKLYLIIKKHLKSILLKFKIKKEKRIENDVNKRYENIILHGSFLIFSQKYIEKFDGLDSRTFLYREEELLYIRLKENNLINIYNPNIIIFHNEDSSTNAITKNNRKKELFVCRNQIKSTKILINEMKKTKEL